MTAQLRSIRAGPKDALLARSAKEKQRRIPLGLKRVRKAIPPPGKIFKSKNKDSRRRAKEELRRELHESVSRNSS